MAENNFEIIPLPKDEWKGTPIPMTTRSDSYYDIELSPLNGEGCNISLIKKPSESAFI